MVIKRMKTQILNKLYRKVNLDKEMGSEWSTYRGIFDWIRLLRRIDDNKLQKLCGTDIALYIIFLRYSSRFFLAVSFLNIFALCLYLTGEPSENEGAAATGDPQLRALTIENCSASPWKIWIAFFLCLFCVTCLVLHMIFNYMMKFQQQEEAETEQ